MDVSIILVSYNTKELTLECIKSIYEKTNGIDFDIYVVDNNSQDGSCEAIEQNYPNVKLIKNKNNKGFGAANNIAIKLSNAKYIFCLNTDTLLLNNAIKVLFDYMELDQSIGACGGQILDKNKFPTYSAGNFPTIQRIFFQFLGLNQILKKYWNEKLSPAKIITSAKPTEVDYIIGADLMLRKSVLNIIGVFDENIFLYGEESDLCFRITKHGKKIMHIPEAKIIHLQGKSSQNINKIQISYNSLIYWYKKNISYIASIILQIFMCINFLFCFFLFNKKLYQVLFITHLKKILSLKF